MILFVRSLKLLKNMYYDTIVVFGSMSCRWLCQSLQFFRILRMLVPKEKVGGYKFKKNKFFMAKILYGGSSSQLASCPDYFFMCDTVSLSSVSKNYFDILPGFCIQCSQSSLITSLLYFQCLFSLSVFFPCASPVFTRHVEGSLLQVLHNRTQCIYRFFLLNSKTNLLFYKTQDTNCLSCGTLKLGGRGGDYFLAIKLFA